jgi:GH18 family chitinase
MNVMTYDFYGTWSSVTGHVSPLFQNPADPQQAGSGGIFMWELSADYDGGSQDLLDAMYDVWKSAE